MKVMAEEGFRLLVIDDDVRIREMMATVLKAAGYRVDVAGGGVEGVKMAQAHEYQLVLLDMMMPVVDGIAVLRELRQAAKTARTAVVCMTNLDQAAISDKVTGLKPIAIWEKQELLPEELVSRVKTMTNYEC